MTGRLRPAALPSGRGSFWKMEPCPPPAVCSCGVGDSRGNFFSKLPSLCPQISGAAPESRGPFLSLWPDQAIGLGVHWNQEATPGAAAGPPDQALAPPEPEPAGRHRGSLKGKGLMAVPPAGCGVCILGLCRAALEALNSMYIVVLNASSSAWRHWMVFPEVGWALWGNGSISAFPIAITVMDVFTGLLDAPEQFGSSCRLN